MIQDQQKKPNPRVINANAQQNKNIQEYIEKALGDAAKEVGEIEKDIDDLLLNKD